MDSLFAAIFGYFAQSCRNLIVH